MKKTDELIGILEERLRFIKMTVTEREYLDNTINKLEEAINYTLCCTGLKTVNEPLPYAEWKANLKMQKIEETIFKIGNDYKTMNDLLDMYGSYCNSF